MHRLSRIFVAGHRGLAGSAIVRKLQIEGYTNILSRSRLELDLEDSCAVQSFFGSVRPEYVFLAAAKVGGILANRDFPVDFLLQNLLIQNNVIQSAWRYGVRKLVFLGSSCIYPKNAPQPMREEHLLTGALETTNDAYAIAKIAGIRLLQAYRQQYGFSGISLMPTNLYGPNDNHDLQTSHVLPALMRKFHEAKESRASHVTVWGTGNPLREFLYVDDLADAAHFLMLNYDHPEIVNVGTGQDLTIRELAVAIGNVVGYTGEIQFDSSKPDGTPRKLLNVSKINRLGWLAKTSLETGLRQTYRWVCNAGWNEASVPLNGQVSELCKSSVNQ